MTGNTEQSLKLENTENIKETKVEEILVLEPLAAPYRLIFSLDKDELEKEISEFWDVNGNDIVKKVNYKGKKRKGGGVDLKKARPSIEKSYGHKALYGNILSKIVVDKVKEKYGSEGKRCMYIQKLTLDLKDENNPLLLCIFYFWSRMTFDGTLNYDIDQPVHWNLEREIQNRQEQLQQIHKISTEQVIPETGEVLDNIFYDSKYISEDQEVLIDLIASCEGKPCDEKSFRGKTLKVGTIMPIELRQSILDHKSGDLFELSYVNTQKDAFEDKTVEAHVKIFKVLDITYIDKEDDALYQKEGFEDFEGFKEAFEKQYNDYITNAKRSLSFDHIVNQLITESEFENLPQPWVDMRSKFFADQHIQNYGGNLEKSRKSLGIAEDAPINKAFEGRVFQEALNQMAIHQYCDMFSLETDANVMADHILTNVNWILPQQD